MDEVEKKSLLDKKWKLHSERNLAIQDCDYDKAKSLLKEIVAINKKVYYPKL